MRAGVWRGACLGAAVLAGAIFLGRTGSEAVASERTPRVVPPRGATGGAVTFSKEIVRILQANCQKCHREGGIGPFPLITYADAYSHRADILVNTTQRKMPPWHVSSACNSYEGDPSLSDADLAAITNWVASVAPEGDPRDLPLPATFPSGWTLGTPDLVLTMPQSFKPDFSKGDVYRCFVLPTGLTEDRYVRAAEILPGARTMVHHVILFLDTSGQAQKLDEAEPGLGYTCFGGPGFDVNPLASTLGGWAPGNEPRFLADGLGLPLPKGAAVVMQVHYSAQNGTGGSDQSNLGIYVTKAPVQKRVLVAPVINQNFIIPAGMADYEVTASIPFLPFDAHLIAVTPHMHLLGRTMRLTETRPDGQTVCLVDVPDWDFHWQASYYYKSAIAAPTGTGLYLSAHYDNSSGNPLNPNNPPKAVGWGENTTDEMCIGFLAFTLDSENLSGSGAVSPERAAEISAAESFLGELWSQVGPGR
jgi:hypothetical protein